MSIWAVIAEFAARNWRVIASALLLAAVGGLSWALYAQIRDNGALAEQKRAVEMTAQANAAAFDAAMAQRDRDLHTVTKERDDTVRRLNNLSQARKEIADAPESDDGPVAPVLLRGLAAADRMRPQRPDDTPAAP